MNNGLMAQSDHPKTVRATKRVNIRLSPGELDELNAAATAAGVAPRTFAYRAVIAAIHAAATETPSLLPLLRAALSVRDQAPEGPYVATASLVELLRAIPDAPWSRVLRPGLAGQRTLADMLRDIPRSRRQVGGSYLHAYRWSALEDAVSRPDETPGIRVSDTDAR